MTISRLRQCLALPAACLALSGCGGGDTGRQTKPNEDPALAAALAGPVMVDPDLTHQNAAGAAIAGGGPVVIELPPVERSPEAIAAILAEAVATAGRKIESAPASSGKPPAAVAQAITPAQLMDAIRPPGAACGGGKLEYGFGWTLALPTALPIYPRGHVVEAAGSKQPGCAVQFATFVTPVKPGDVLDFYATRAKVARMTVKRFSDGEMDLLTGSGSGIAFALRVRPQEDGLTRADLISL